MAEGSSDLAQVLSVSPDVSSASVICVSPTSTLYNGHYRTLFYTAGVAVLLLPARRWITHGYFTFYLTYVSTAAIYALALYFVSEGLDLPMDAIVVPKVLMFSGGIMMCLRLCRPDLFPRNAAISYAFEVFIRVCQGFGVLLEIANKHIKTQAEQLGKQVPCVPSSVLSKIPTLVSSNRLFHIGNDTLCVDPCQAAFNNTSVNPDQHQLRPVRVLELSSAIPPGPFKDVVEYAWVYILVFVTSVAVSLHIFIGPRTARNYLYYGLSLRNPSSSAWLLACKIVALVWYIWGFISFFLQMANNFLYTYGAERVLENIPVTESSKFVGRWGLWAEIILTSGVYTWLSRMAKDEASSPYDSSILHFWRGIILSPIDGCQELRKWWQDPMYNTVTSVEDVAEGKT